MADSEEMSRLELIRDSDLVTCDKSLEHTWEAAPHTKKGSYRHLFSEKEMRDGKGTVKITVHPHFSDDFLDKLVVYLQEIQEARSRLRS